MQYYCKFGLVIRYWKVKIIVDVKPGSDQMKFALNQDKKTFNNPLCNHL